MINIVDEDIDRVFHMIGCGMNSRREIIGVLHNRVDSYEERIAVSLTAKQIFDFLKAQQLIEEAIAEEFKLTHKGIIINQKGGYLKHLKEEKLSKANEDQRREQEDEYRKDEVEAAKKSAETAEKSLYVSLLALLISLIAVLISIYYAKV